MNAKAGDTELFSEGVIRHRVMMVVDLPPNVSKLFGPGLVVSRHRVSFDMSEIFGSVYVTSQVG